MQQVAEILDDFSKYSIVSDWEYNKEDPEKKSVDIDAVRTQNTLCRVF